LFWKFTIGMVLVVVLFGSINVILVHRIIFSSLEDELKHRGEFMSEIISQQATTHVLKGDIDALIVFIDEVKSLDTAIEYILVSDANGKVIAHTFDSVLPAELLDVHSGGQTNEVRTAYVNLKGVENVAIRDISVPLLDGSVGYLRLGITEEIISRTLGQATQTLLGMILILILISLLGTFIFSYLVTSPIKDISQIAENLNMQSIREKNVMFASRYPSRAGRLMKTLPGDEIDILVAKFNEMVFRLQQAYDELEVAQRKLVQSEKLASIGSLAAGVAHEVNNPLAGIMNCIARMKKNPENRKEAEKYLDLMEEATGKMETVIKNLLNFARKPDNSKTAIIIEPVVENALALASHRLKKNNIRITFDNHAEQRYFRANANQLEQVLLNLFINSADAIEEMMEKQPNLSGKLIVCSRPLDEGRRLLIEITDNGIGIPDENMNKILDPFFTTKAVGKGTGLGLSVSMNIIQEHGGDMEIVSQFRKGTTVRIILPGIL
jgi:two-component system, NtrC family, sensor kinase